MSNEIQYKYMENKNDLNIKCIYYCTEASWWSWFTDSRTHQFNTEERLKKSNPGVHYCIIVRQVIEKVRSIIRSVQNHRDHLSKSVHRLPQGYRADGVQKGQDWETDGTHSTTRTAKPDRNLQTMKETTVKITLGEHVTSQVSARCLGDGLLAVPCNTDTR